MLKKQPLVSIITPCFNQGRFIEECILSIKNQTYCNIEHIIVDAVSTDDTIERIKKYENQYNLKWVSEKDRGQADAIKKGYAMASGEIVTWLNSDDFYLHKFVVEEVVEYFNKYETADIVTGGGYYVDIVGKYISRIRRYPHRISLEYMKCADYILQPSTFIKTSINDLVFIDIDYTYVFDWLYFLDMFTKKANFLVVDNCFSAYRMYENNKTGMDNAKRKSEIAKVARGNFGLLHLQTIHCYLIYFFYSVADFLPESISRRFKIIVNHFNKFIARISDGKITSC